MKSYWVILGLILFLSYLPKSYAQSSPEIEVGFTPKRPGIATCQELVIKEIQAAKKQILVQAYGFTSQPIIQALNQAKSRGLLVQVVLDRSDQKKLQGLIFPVKIDNRHAISHNKVMIFDDQKVETGSFNYTKAAQEKNAENCLVINNKEIAKQYADNWQEHWQHAQTP